MANSIRFGTDGWRAIIGEDFTFENVRACAQAIAEYVSSTNTNKKLVIVGYDTRFESDEFAKTVARVLAGNGIAVQISDRPAPTPAFSFRVVEAKASGAVIVTSSHNPYQWNGIKIKSHLGGSASPEIVNSIEQRANDILKNEVAVHIAPSNSDLITKFNPLEGYLAHLKTQIDLPRIQSSGLHLAVDSMYGTGSGLLKEILEGKSLVIDEIHSEINPRFPGIRAPEPVEENLQKLIKLTTTKPYSIGLANDGDADRLGIVDPTTGYLDSLGTFAILVNYLLAEKNLTGAVIKSITTTNMVKLLAEKYGSPCYETPVGFKYIGPSMVENDALIGGEESGGYGFRGHIPERDGILAALYLIEAIVTTGKEPHTLLEDIYSLVGTHFYERIDIEITEEQRPKIQERLKTFDGREIAGEQIQAIDTRDGWRFLLKDGWLLFRISGTEPLLRIYTEFKEKENIARLLESGRQIIDL
tara:strand:+ start:825 stop:2240 length:1416 start_codon:yes stop_codon:yes gene_type:complete